MKKYIFYWLALCIVIVVGCQKELSFEGPNSPAEGSLQADITGDCLPKTVNGVYEVGKPLVADSNTISVDVNVVTTGTYIITTDTVNGYFFRATGIFTTPGVNTIKLRGNGTPFAALTNNFVVTFDSTVCDVQVQVLPAGAGGPAVFTIQNAGTPANCSGATSAGTYIIGTPLNSSNTVTLLVNVTTIGTYNISTVATNGMVFSKSGAFLATGVQTLVLTGSGTPTGTPGAVTIPITAGSTTCDFGVTTVAGADFSIDCATAVVNGTYQVGTALTATNTVDITVNVTTGGPYSISTLQTNGMVFSASGTFAGPGTFPITLTGSGTPLAVATSNIPVPGNTACTFDVIVVAGATVDWKFTEGPTTYQGTTLAAILTSILPPFLNLAYTGMDVPGNQFGFNLVDVSGTISASETYSTVISANNSAVFTFFLAGGGDQLTTDATRNVIFTVTGHDVPNKIITGSFAGQAKNNAGTTKNITNGTFTVNYQ